LLVEWGRLDLLDLALHLLLELLQLFFFNEKFLLFNLSCLKLLLSCKKLLLRLNEFVFRMGKV
jgi:hypothetical protein